MSEEKGLLRGNATTLILVVLKEEARHGYDIAREVERRSDSALTFRHGTLYPILHTLEKDGLITSAWVHADGERPRRVYSLTESGRAELERCIQTWDTFSHAMNQVIRGRPGEQQTT